jgi:hypothetical protein
VEDPDEAIGAVMGEIPVETHPLDLDLDLETVRPHGPLPLPAMKCIRAFHEMQNRMTPKSELGSETARMVTKSMDRQTFSVCL